MARPPLDCREWLEDILVSPDQPAYADFAAEALLLISHGDIADEQAQEWSDCGFACPDDASNAVGLITNLADLLSAYEVSRELGDADDISNWIDNVLEYTAKLEKTHFALFELCHAAGLLKPNDYQTDPFPLLRMFLPIREFSEENCPGHAASPQNAKICQYCGTHINSLRPD